MNLVSWRNGHWYITMVGVVLSLTSASGLSDPEDQVEAAGGPRVRRASFNAWAGKRSSEETISLDEEGLERLVQEIKDSLIHQDSGKMPFHDFFFDRAQIIPNRWRKNALT